MSIKTLIFLSLMNPENHWLNTPCKILPSPYHKDLEKVEAFLCIYLFQKLLNAERKSGSSRCFECVKEVSISCYDDDSEASLFSACLSISPAAVCLPYSISTCWCFALSACLLACCFLSVYVLLHIFFSSFGKKKVDIVINKVQF